jgi:hypothetical protein
MRDDDDEKPTTIPAEDREIEVAAEVLDSSVLCRRRSGWRCSLGRSPRKRPPARGGRRAY